VPADSLQGDTVRFPSEQSHQIRQVLRLRPGDTVTAVAGSGTEYVVTLEHVGRDVSGRIAERRRNQAEPRLRVTLYQALLKGSRMDLVLQKGTEIGVTGFVPVLTARAVPAEPSAAKQRRYETIVREAAEQSGRGRLPEVREAVSLGDALTMAQGTIIFPWEGEYTRHLRDVPLDESGVSLFIGPEGGWTEEEVRQAAGAGALVVTLGPRILRAETAAIVTSALVLARAGEFA